MNKPKVTAIYCDCIANELEASAAVLHELARSLEYCGQRDSASKIRDAIDLVLAQRDKYSALALKLYDKENANAQ